MITAYFQVKGGDGKSTLSSNDVVQLVLNGQEVIYVNADPQSATATFWSEERSDNPDLPRITTIEKYGKSLGNDVLDLSEKYQNVVVDLGAQDKDAYRKVLLIADVVVMPIKPSAADVWASVEKTLKVIEECKTVNSELKVFVVINMGPANPNDKDVHDLKSGLEELENVTVIKQVVKDRKAYRRAMKNGRGVLELTRGYKDYKAIDEVMNLYQEIYNHAG